MAGDIKGKTGKQDEPRREALMLIPCNGKFCADPINSMMHIDTKH